MASSLLRDPRIAEINLDLATMSPYLVARKYDLTRTTVHRYHIGEWKDLAASTLNALSKKRDKKTRQNCANRDKFTKADQALVIEAERADHEQHRQELIVLSGETIVTAVQNAFTEVDKLLRLAAGDPDKQWSKSLTGASLLLSASRELRDAAKTLLDFYLQARTSSAGRITDHPDWLEFRNRIAGALAGNPDVLRQITEIEADHE